MPRLKRYLDQQPGRQRDSLWTDAPVIHPEAIDCDWDTRKPRRVSPQSNSGAPGLASTLIRWLNRKPSDGSSMKRG